MDVLSTTSRLSRVQPPLIPVATPTVDATGDRALRIRLLARRLEDKATLNTRHSRAQCRHLARAILELLEEEDRQGQARSRIRDPRSAVARLRNAIQACRHAGEVAELTRLLSVSERVHRHSTEGRRSR
jgi:hypothetical protein